VLSRKSRHELSSIHITDISDPPTGHSERSRVGGCWVGGRLHRSLVCPFVIGSVWAVLRGEPVWVALADRVRDTQRARHIFDPVYQCLVTGGETGVSSPLVFGRACDNTCHFSGHGKDATDFAGEIVREVGPSLVGMWRRGAGTPGRPACTDYVTLKIPHSLADRDWVPGTITDAKLTSNAAVDRHAIKKRQLCRHQPAAGDAPGPVS